MRYTTLIDISEIPELYRNCNIRMLYLHLVLKSGYHDDDRDIVRLSIRRMAYDTGLSISAVRHGLQQLKNHGLLDIVSGQMRVKKFVIEQPISKRARTKKEQSDQELTRIRERQQRTLEQQYARMGDQEYDDSFIKTYEGFLKALQDGSISLVGRKYLQANEKRYNELKSKK